ncbi:MAG TPA: DUF1161 domain-containing protein, partial [Vicinamibacterales bacterium]|nr:DUF1161 domain-containing protein [Vicinamibacterales bacterium]
MTVRSLVFVVIVIAAIPRAADASSQMRLCADLGREIIDKLRQRGVTHFTLTIVRPGDEGERRIVGSCQDSTRRIVYEPRGKGELVDDTATRAKIAPAPGAAPSTRVPSPPPPKETSAPIVTRPKEAPKSDLPAKIAAPPPIAA